MAGKKPECVDYFEQVLDGRIVACRRLKQLAAIMLDRIENGYKDWHFDYEYANKPVRFVQQFCRLSTGKMGEPFVLELFQKAIIQVMFGFVDDHGYRQFHEVLWVMGRKNGKSQLAAALELFMLMADGEGAPQVYNAATSKSQASLAYGAALKMMRMSGTLSKRLRKGTVPDRDEDGIIYSANQGYISVLTSQTRHLDGLNVHFCVFDELAACTNRDQYDLIRQGMSARDQPMMLCITTSGFQRDNIYDDRYNYACRILDGEIDDSRFLPVLFELDAREEWTDETCWIKANPGLSKIKRMSAMRDIVAEAMQNPGLVPTVLVKDCCIPENQAAAWLTFEECVNEAPFVLQHGEFRYGIAGFDFAETTDLAAAKMLMMKPGDDHIFEESMYWIPEASLRDDGLRTERDDAPYRLWEKRGLLRIVPGNRLSPSIFVEWLDELRDDYDVWCYAIGFDPWHIMGSDRDALEQYVGKERLEGVRQGAKTLSMPMKALKAELRDNRIVDGGNPINQWCRANVSAKSDANDNVTPVKVGGKSKLRIDGFMAELCGFVALERHRDDYLAVI